MSVTKLLSALLRTGDASAYDVYGALVAQSRKPEFYETFQVPDSPGGRFELIVLHVFLLFQRLQNSAAERKLAQQVVDVMFADMDRSLRELGVGDLSIAKKIRPMAEAYAGRARAYEAAASEPGDTALTEAILRNIFAGEAGRARAAEGLARYARAARECLAARDFAALARGQLGFPDPGRLEDAP